MRAKAYYINLDRETGRRSHMTAQAKSLNLEFVRVPAIDAREPAEPSVGGYTPHDFRFGRWELRNLEIAVFSSHRAVWRLIADGRDDYAIIMEDDLIFSPDFREKVNALIESGFGFDIIRLNTSGQQRLFGKKIELGENVLLRRIYQYMADAGCYLVTKTACKQLLAQTEEFCDHLDDFVFSPNRGSDNFQIDPPIAGQVIHEADVSNKWDTEGISVSGRLEELEKRPGKGPVTFRLVKEWHRMVWSVRKRILTVSGKARNMRLKKILAEGSGDS